MTDPEASPADAADAADAGTATTGEATPAGETESAADPAAAEPGPAVADEDAYSGLLGAFPFAFRRTESRLCKAYVAIGGLLGAGLGLFFTMALVVQVFATLSGTGGLFTFSRALFILVGLFVVGPVLAPTLLVARRHRRTGSDAGYDRLLAASGFGFLASLYLFAVGAASPDLRDPATAAGPLEPLVAALYALPPAAALVFPLAAAAAIAAAHRYAR